MTGLRDTDVAAHTTQAVDNTAFHVRRQAEAALTLATRRTGKLGGWSREARDPNVLRRELEVLARNTLAVVARLEADRG